LVKRTLVAECERLGVGREWPDDVGEYVDGHPGSDCERGLTDPRVGVWADGRVTDEEPRLAVDDEPQHAAVGDPDLDSNDVQVTGRPSAVATEATPVLNTSCIDTQNVFLSPKRADLPLIGMAV